MDDQHARQIIDNEKDTKASIYIEQLPTQQRQDEIIEKLPAADMKSYDTSAKRLIGIQSKAKHYRSNHNSNNGN